MQGIYDIREESVSKNLIVIEYGMQKDQSGTMHGIYDIREGERGTRKNLIVIEYGVRLTQRGASSVNCVLQLREREKKKVPVFVGIFQRRRFLGLRVRVRHEGYGGLG